MSKKSRDIVPLNVRFFLFRRENMFKRRETKRNAVQPIICCIVNCAPHEGENQRNKINIKSNSKGIFIGLFKHIYIYI